MAATVILHARRLAAQHKALVFIAHDGSIPMSKDARLALMDIGHDLGELIDDMYASAHTTREADIHWQAR